MEVNKPNEVLPNDDVNRHAAATTLSGQTFSYANQPRPRCVISQKNDHRHSWKHDSEDPENITPRIESQSKVSLIDDVERMATSGEENGIIRVISNADAAPLKQVRQRRESIVGDLSGRKNSRSPIPTRRKFSDSKQDPEFSSSSSSSGSAWQLVSSSDSLSKLSAEEDFAAFEKVSTREKTRKSRSRTSKTKPHKFTGSKSGTSFDFRSSFESQDFEMDETNQVDEIVEKHEVVPSTDHMQHPEQVDEHRRSTDSSSSLSKTIADPWVRASAMTNTSRVHFADVHNNQPCDHRTATSEFSSAASRDARDFSHTGHTCENGFSSNARANSQAEYGCVTPRRDPPVSCQEERHLGDCSDFRQRLRNDLDLLSRPSWCDAKFALSRIEQGKAKGNRYALRFRSYLHRFLFWMGCSIQEWAPSVVFVGILVLGACCVALKTAHLETNIEKLWVETGGVLEKELNYLKTKTSGSGYSMQMLIQTGPNTATVESLKLHLHAAVQATKVSVYMYNKTWTFDDVCYKEALPQMGEDDRLVSSILRNLIPCSIIGPLDCFWDGAKLMGPAIPIATVAGIPPFTWKNLDPMSIVDVYLNTVPDTSRTYRIVRRYKDMMIEAGLVAGYVDRWCLDPFEKECPETAPNYKTDQLPNITQLFEAGCAGYAKKLMQWPLDLIVGGIKRDSSGNIASTGGLQTLFQLMSAKNMYNFHNTFRTKDIYWDVERAGEIVAAWQRKFVNTAYKINPSVASNAGNDSLYAFGVVTASDILRKFTNVSMVRVAGGYLVMIGYAFIALMRLTASRSQSAVGVIGVLLIALSVAAGLGIASWIGISFNAASTQVLPFLMLGLGVDDMFLMVHHFGEIAVLNYIPFEERTGECLKRVGVSVALTSIAIMSGFLCSLVIPMPALRAFGLQAAIVTVFNLVSVLCIFPAVLSIDLKRRKNNKYDILCCFKSSNTSEVIDFREQNPIPVLHCHCHHQHHPPTRNVHLPTSNHTDIDVESQMTENGGAAITMRHTIQAYANHSYTTVLAPPVDTTFNGSGIAQAHGRHFGVEPTGYTPSRTPPPVYTPRDGDSAKGPPQKPKVAFVCKPEIPEPVPPAHGRIMTHRSAVAPVSSARGARTPGSTPSTNLTTPMESVRSSTHSLVPKRKKRNSFWCCVRSGKRNGDFYARLTVLQSITLSQIGERYYAPLLTKNPVRIVVSVLFVLLLGASVYGCTIVKDGLDLGDILPKGTREHQAIVAQTSYFSFHSMYIITKEFDYASEQRNLYRMHEQIANISYVMKQTDGTNPKFWLHYFRDYLKSLQDSFDRDWALNNVNAMTWTTDASDNTVLAYKLLVQTGKEDQPSDPGRIGCYPTNGPCKRVNRVRLVSDEGLIPTDAFYNYLSVWVSNDPMGYAASQAQMKPKPPSYEHNRADANLIIPRASAITYSQMPYYLNGMRENEDFVSVIRSVRSICNTMSAETDIDAFPTGYPFTFWQQYIDLRFWLFVSLAAVIGAVFIVLSVVLFNPWASAVMTFFLIMITTELLGFMGWSGIKLSAVPAVILVASIGLGVEFTVHITFAFISSCGSRRERVARSLGHMLGPVFDGSVSTLLGVVMLAGSEFEFIVKYFFNVLAFLILLGVLNGLVLLPVVLSFIGPRAEVEPTGGGTRLKTPTPPPTPPGELECGCIHCTHQQVRYNANTNNSVCQCIRCVQYRRYYARSGRASASSHDDHHAWHSTPRLRFPRDVTSHRSRGYGASNYCQDAGPYRTNLHQRRAPGTSRMRGAPLHYHPHAIPPICEEEERGSNVCINPRSEFVIYTTGDDSSANLRQPHIPHCESNESRSSFKPIRPETDSDAVRPAAHVSRMNMTMVDSQTSEHIATLSSSLTLHTRGRPTRVVSFMDPGPTSSSNPGLHSEYVWHPHGVSEPSTHYLAHPSPRRFDISALNDIETAKGGQMQGSSAFRY